MTRTLALLCLLPSCTLGAEEVFPPHAPNQHTGCAPTKDKLTQECVGSERICHPLEPTATVQKCTDQSFTGFRHAIVYACTCGHKVVGTWGSCEKK